MSQQQSAEDEKTKFFKELCALDEGENDDSFDEGLTASVAVLRCKAGRASSFRVARVEAGSKCNTRPSSFITATIFKERKQAAEVPPRVLRVNSAPKPLDHTGMGNDDDDAPRLLPRL